MIDLVEAYSSFPNLGYPVEPNPLLEVKNHRGEVIYHNDCALDNKNCLVERVWSPLTAFQITSILSDNQARSPAFGLHSVLDIPKQQVAVKTGTTNSLRDNWTIGYTSDRLVAVWVGNNDNTPMSYVASGITGASPIWNFIMRSMLSDEQPHTFSRPVGLVEVKVCAKTGTLPCAGCPVVKTEVYVQGTEPKVACNPAQFQPPKPTGEPKPATQP